MLLILNQFIFQTRFLWSLRSFSIIIWSSIISLKQFMPSSKITLKENDLYKIATKIPVPSFEPIYVFNPKPIYFPDAISMIPTTSFQLIDFVYPMRTIPIPFSQPINFDYPMPTNPKSSIWPINFVYSTQLSKLYSYHGLNVHLNFSIEFDASPIHLQIRNRETHLLTDVQQ